MKMTLIRVVDIYRKEHYINQDAIVELDPNVPNLEQVVAIELNNGHRILVNRSIAQDIIANENKILDLVDKK